MDLEPIYSEMIAGAIPYTSDVEASIALVAGAALGTERLHMLAAAEDDTAFYLAVSSKALASAPNFATPLAAALPSHPQHKGDGIYVIYHGPIGVAVYKHGKSLKLMCNSASVITERLQTEDDPIYEVERNEPWALSSSITKARGTGNKLSSWIMKIGFAWALVASIAAAGIATVNGAVLGAKDNPTNRIRQIEDIVSKVTLVQPLSNDVAEMQRVTSVVVKAEGWIEKYSLKGGKEEFEVRFPGYTSKDVIDALGSGIHSDYDKSKDLIIVRKGAKS